MDGVVRELESRNGEIWCHQFRLPSANLKIADLQPDTSFPFINQAFEFAEQGSGDEFSRTVAVLVSKDFAGMLVPGIRGEKDKKYNNIVLFQFSDWEGRLTGEPMRL
jgi:hypothetical protein